MTFFLQFCDNICIFSQSLHNFHIFFFLQSIYKIHIFLQFIDDISFFFCFYNLYTRFFFFYRLTKFECFLSTIFWQSPFWKILLLFGTFHPHIFNHNNSTFSHQVPTAYFHLYKGDFGLKLHDTEWLACNYQHQAYSKILQILITHFKI